MKDRVSNGRDAKDSFDSFVPHFPHHSASRRHRTEKGCIKALALKKDRFSNGQDAKNFVDSVLPLVPWYSASSQSFTSTQNQDRTACRTTYSTLVGRSVSKLFLLLRTVLPMDKMQRTCSTRSFSSSLGTAPHHSA
jgi:hypothetical protein